jgi:hypothetical protein
MQVKFRRGRARGIIGDPRFLAPPPRVFRRRFVPGIIQALPVAVWLGGGGVFRGPLVVELPPWPPSEEPVCWPASGTGVIGVVGGGWPSTSLGWDGTVIRKPPTAEMAADPYQCLCGATVEILGCGGATAGAVHTIWSITRRAGGVVVTATLVGDRVSRSRPTAQPVGGGLRPAQ